MAFTGITATEAEIDQKMGVNAPATFTDTMKTAALLQAESFVNCISRNNWSDDYATLNVDKKYIITQITASIVAIEGIKFDMNSYTDNIEGEDMINALWAIVSINLQLLKDQKVVDFIKKP